MGKEEYKWGKEADMGQEDRHGKEAEGRWVGTNPVQTSFASGLEGIL